MLKKIIAAAAAVVVAVSACGCSVKQSGNMLAEYDFSTMKLVQLEEPAEGQDVVVIETTEGNITAVLYAEYAPNTVQNFKNRISEKFYDGKPFFAVEPMVYAITGSSKEDGSEGVTDDGKFIKNECNANLWPYKGALLSYSGQQGFSDSRFFFCGAIEITDENKKELQGYKDEKTGAQVIPDSLIDSFRNRGSVPGFAGIYTVFGQIINGYDTLDKILSTASDDKNKKPEKDIKIVTIRLESYEKGKYTIEEPTADKFLTAEEMAAMDAASGLTGGTGATSSTSSTASGASDKSE